MKIAIFSDTYIPDINGVATSTRILRNELVKRGHDVLVVTSELPSDSDYQDDPSENILRVPGLEIQKLYGYRACNIYSFKGMRELKNQGIEIIHTQTEFGIGIFSRIAGEALNIPVVYTYHTMWADYSHYVTPVKSNAVDGLVKKVISRISKLYGDTCTELIVPSVKTKEALEQYGIDKHMHVIPTGLELQRFDPNRENKELSIRLIKEYDLEGKFVITFLGRIAKEKSIDIIIEAIKELVTIRQDFKCLIVGGGPSVKELQDLVHSYQLDEYILFTGPKEATLVPAHYHISNVFVSASLSETQGLTFIEAMASGIPVIARRDKNLEDVIIHERNGYFFEETKELTTLLNKVMDSDLHEMEKNAYHDAMRFSSEVFGEKVLEVYQEAILHKHYTYRVKSIYPIKDGRNEVVFLLDESEIILELSNQVIEQYNIQRGIDVSRDTFDTLKDLEQISRAYSKALKYLTLKDYTEGQMRKRLMDSGDYDDTQLDATMELLKEKNLINDEAYVLNYLKRCTRLSIGLNKAIYNLRSYEIDSETIDHCLEEFDDDEEYNAAIELIESMYNKFTTSSHKALIKRIRDKLYFKGFSSDTIERAMNDFDFSYSDEKEQFALQKEFDKVFLKYSRKLEGKELDEKIIDVLLRKGYSYGDIKKRIQEKGEQIHE